MSMRIDASVQVFFKNDRDLRSMMVQPFASRGFPEPDTFHEAPPDGVRYVAGSENPDGTHPGSDPEKVGKLLFEEQGLDYAILHPMSGAALLPDYHLGNHILSCTNRMLAERWLESGTYKDRFRGTIRVNTHHVEGAIREIKQWQDHPGMVQIGLPLQTLTPYGRPEYTPLWKAIADSGLPAAIHAEYGRGISHPPTPSGVTRTFSHLHAYRGTTYIYHLMNMIAEGVFESFPDLKVIWADGGSDMVTPFMWRMDTFGRPHLEQTPWAPLIPSDYLADTNYFIFTKFDGPGDAAYASEWLSFTGKEDLLMFGSAYPSWKTHTPDLPGGWTEGQRSRVLGDTAAKVFGLDQLVAV